MENQHANLSIPANRQQITPITITTGTQERKDLLLTMTTTILDESLKGGIVGRKRTRPTFKKPTLREKFALRLHDLADAAGSPTYERIATAVGVSKIAVVKWFSGERFPADMDQLPKLASVLGLKDYRDLFPPS